MLLLLVSVCVCEFCHDLKQSLDIFCLYYVGLLAKFIPHVLHLNYSLLPPILLLFSLSYFCIWVLLFNTFHIILFLNTSSFFIIKTDKDGLIPSVIQIPLSLKKCTMQHFLKV